jgi:PKD repeat protein
MFLTMSSVFGQTMLEEQQRFSAMKAEEVKVNAFVNEHFNDDLPKEVDVFIEALIKEESAEHEISAAEIQRVRQTLRRKYLRQVYFKENPAAFALYQASAIGNCVNGDFEAGNFSGYGAASGPRGSTIGDCDIASILYTPEVPQTIETSGGSGGINCEIVGTGMDPLIPSLPMVHSGNFAARINQTVAGFGSNQITKKLVLTQPNENIAYWFSLVMQNPNGHNNRQPFFKARALNAAGVVLDESCEFADALNPFFNNTVISGQTVVYSPYYCDRLEVSGNIGDTITLEISTADCGAGAHWGYSYVDDICNACTIDSCNFQGSIDLNPTDTCAANMQVCGTYTLAALQCTSATVQNITLDIVQGGVVIGTLASPSIDTVAQTFCFSVTPATFAGYTGGFDFQANITFSVNGGTTTESDLNTNPGTDNDYILDANCCPTFRVLDCCEYWNLSARGVNIDPQIKRTVEEYQNMLKTKYGASRNTTDCDPCAFPTDSFPVFIVDQNNMLVDDSYYAITWSHNPGWTAAYDWIFPNQQTIVTVSDPNSNCVFVDTFKTECCEEIEIASLCTTCDPCANPSQPFFLIVKDSNGNPISGAGYTFNWSTGATSSGINAMVNTQYWVSVTDLATGCVSTDTFEINCCSCDVRAMFNASVNKCTVNFAGGGIVPSCSQIVGYQWDFGDGNTSSLQGPSHTYAANGTYNVCLIVYATDGTDRCSDTLCKTVRITDCDPCECGFRPDFRYTIDKCEVKFEGFANPNECTKVDKYIWDFGDGNTSTLQNPTHTYTSNGTYEVCLVVEGNDGKQKCEEKVCYQIEITDCAPCDCKVEASYLGLMGINDPCTIFYTQTAQTNKCTNITSYAWDFGDGTTSTLANPAHTFPGNGTYNVCLTVYATNGTKICKDTYCLPTTIQNCRGVISPSSKNQTGGSTSEASLNDFDASVYPNPFTDHFEIAFTNSTEQEIEINLFDVNGKQIATLLKENRAAGTQLVRFNSADYKLSQGIYFVSIKSATKMSFTKIVNTK